MNWRGKGPQQIQKKQSECQAASAEHAYLSRTEFSCLWAFVRKKKKISGNRSALELTGVMTLWGNSMECLHSSSYFSGLLQES